MNSFGDIVDKNTSSQAVGAAHRLGKHGASLSILDYIVVRENEFINELRQAQEEGFPIYIMGSAHGGGKQAAICLENAQIPYEGLLVSRAFWAENSPEQCLEDFMERIQTKVCIVIAFRGYHEGTLEPYRDKINRIIVRDCFAGIRTAGDSGFMTYDWVVEHREQLQNTFDILKDELSRESMAAYINQKISADFKYLAEVKREHQYFEDGVVELSADERFLDCGAFDGDSAAAFLDALQRRGIDSYEEIISFEPDSGNCEKMRHRDLPRHTCICKGAAESPGVVSFAADGTSGRVEADGGEQIELESIDHYLNGTRATMIKMDIEGMELSALKSAEQTIKAWRPKLAICIYHKKEDLWEIPGYIKELVPDYRFYVRAYDDTACELVLYAL